MNEHDVLKKNRNFYIGVGGTVLEGLLSGSLFMLLYSVMQFLWSGQFDMNRVLALTGIIAVVFLLRILIYSYGYTKAQIGGAEVSKNIRLFMGDHLKRISLSRFTPVTDLHSRPMGMTCILKTSLWLMPSPVCLFRSRVF